MSETWSRRVAVVVPFFNEADNVVPVLEEVRRALPDAEIVAVDDGSGDGTWEKLGSVAGVLAVRHPRNLGQSAAFWTGLRRASREICVTMDGDGQNDPADIARLVGRLGDADLACGIRVNRRDSWSRRAASRFANAVRRVALNDGATDTGCSLKAFRREHLEVLVPFDGLHRYVPALFVAAGFRVAEVPVNHRRRERGTTKYTNIGRGIRGLYDLFGVRWLLKRRIAYIARNDR